MKLFMLAVVVLGLTARPGWPQGDPLGPEFRVNTTTFEIQSEARVARSSGGFVVVWGSGPIQMSVGVNGQRYGSDGAPQGPEFLMGSGFQPDVATDASGNFVTVWSSFPIDSFADVVGQRYASSGAPLGPVFRINTYTTQHQYAPAVFSAGPGGFVVVWHSNGQDGSFNGIFGQRYAPGGAPLGPEFRVNTYTSSVQEFPAIAGDTAGNFVVTWSSATQDDVDWGVFAQRYSASGAPLGPEFRVNTITTFRQRWPSVASDGAGNFVVAWESRLSFGSDNNVYAQRFASSGSPLGAEFRVNGATTSEQHAATVAADLAGNFVVAWTSFGGGGTSSEEVFAQRFMASGVPSGAEFRVNTVTGGDQQRAAAAAAPGGEFVVVWDSPVPGGIDVDVFGQRYGLIVPVELMSLAVE